MASNSSSSRGQSSSETHLPIVQGRGERKENAHSHRLIPNVTCLGTTAVSRLNQNVQVALPSCVLHRVSQSLLFIVTEPGGPAQINTSKKPPHIHVPLCLHSLQRLPRVWESPGFASPATHTCSILNVCVLPNSHVET